MLPTDPGFYRDADGDLWVIAPGSTNLRLLTQGGMRATDDEAEMLTLSYYAAFTRVYLITADD